MARVTVEDCLEHIENRFALVMLATERARELRRRGTRIFPSKNKECVHALREIGAGFVDFDENSKRKLAKALGLDELAAEAKLQNEEVG